MNVTGRVPSNVVQYPGNRAGTGRTGGPTRYKASRKAAPSKVTPLYIWGDFDIPFLLLTLALLGFVGACLIVILFALLIWRGYTIALHAKDRFGMLIAVGITTQIGMQVMLNIAVVTNTIPNTGISLPMFSYGGTSLCMILGELGILLAVSRQGIYEKE